MGNKGGKATKTGEVTLTNVPETVKTAFAKAKHDGELILIAQRIEDSNWNAVSIPFDQLIQIWKLDLSRNALTQFPPTIHKHHNLKVIHVMRNQIAAVPGSIGNLKKLMVLDVSFNKLRELPEELGLIPGLQTIIAGNNQIEKMPENLGQCDRLSKMFLNHNPLKNLPKTYIRLAGSLLEMRLDETGMWENLKKRPEFVHVDNRDESKSTYDIAKTLAYICNGGLDNPDKPLTQIMFEKYDQDGSGTIDKYELKDLCYDFGYFMSEAEMDLAFMQLDRDNSGSVDYPEFLGWWESAGPMQGLKLTEVELAARQDAATTFQKYDTDKSGSIDRVEFGGLHQDMQVRGYTAKAVDECLAEIDEDRDGEVQFNEYINWLKKMGILKK